MVDQVLDACGARYIDPLGRLQPGKELLLTLSGDGLQAREVSLEDDCQLNARVLGIAVLDHLFAEHLPDVVRMEASVNLSPSGLQQ